jgi:hypothetical protein
MRLWSPAARGRISPVNRLVSLIAAAALVTLLPTPQAVAETTTVGTAVQVLVHRSFTETSDPDECVGALTLATVRRGSSVMLSEGSSLSDTRKVAVGQFFRSRLKDGVCQVLYITSAPVMPSFNVQFASPEGDLSPTFGPNAAEPVTDQPGIEQVVHVDMEFQPQP